MKKAIVILIIIALLLPISVAIGVSKNCFLWVPISNDWIGFWGGYLGSILGLIGVILTIYYTGMQAAEDRRVQLLPILYIEQLEKLLEKYGEVPFLAVSEGDAKECISAIFKIKNIGAGPMLDVHINNPKYFYRNGGFENKSNIEFYCIEKNKKCYFGIQLFKFMQKEYDIKLAEKMAYEGLITFNIGFYDLFGCYYEYLVSIKHESCVNMIPEAHFEIPKLCIDQYELKKKIRRKKKYI